MGLTLLAGPAHAGKVALLLERYLAALDSEPVLIVPNRSDVERVERDLLRRTGALLGGTIGTFDDVFELIAGRPADRLVGAAEQVLVLRRVVARTELNGLGASARSGGFADALSEAIRELEGALVTVDAAEGDLGRLYRGYRAELAELGLVDRELLRARAPAGTASRWTSRSRPAPSRSTEKTG